MTVLQEDKSDVAKAEAPGAFCADLQCVGRDVGDNKSPRLAKPEGTAGQFAAKFENLRTIGELPLAGVERLEKRVIVAGKTSGAPLIIIGTERRLSEVQITFLHFDPILD